VIDLHSHLLPGIDDGPATLAESVEMARVAWEAGTLAMACTPHMIAAHPTEPQEMLRGVARLRAALDEADIPLAIHPGAEISLDWLGRMSDEDLAMASIGDGPWLLLEMPFRGWPLGLPETLRDLEIRGFRAILAHPERAEAIHRAPDRMRDLIGRGALVQVTAGSFLGEHGPAARRAALILLGGGAAHFIASDSHSAGPWRPPGLDAGLQAAADAIDVEREALGWMVEEGPMAVVEGRPVRPPTITTARRPRGGVTPAPAAPR
jgi:protein-tyrosine phosphatase